MTPDVTCNLLIRAAASQPVDAGGDEAVPIRAPHRNRETWAIDLSVV